MKVLYTNFHTGSGTGGHTVYVLSLAKALAERHQVTVAAPEGSALYRRAAELPGVTVYAQPFPNRPLYLWRAAARLRALIAAEGIELIHVNGSSDHRLAILATLGMGRKRPRIVFTKHNDIPIASFGAWLRASVGTDHTIGVCDFAKRILADSPYRRRPMSTISNGVDTRYFSPAQRLDATALRQSLCRRPECKVLLGSNAGTDDYKGWMDVVEAVSRLPADIRGTVQVALAGAPLNDEQRGRIAALGMAEQVTWAGRLEDVRTFIAALDLGFVMSYRIETISFACREMMAMGKPVIVSSQGGLPENITPGVDGWVVPKRNVEKLTTLLEGILRQPEQLPDAGVAARRKCEQSFRLERFVQRTEHVYETVLGLVRNGNGSLGGVRP